MILQTTDAIREAYASCPATVAEISTIEIIHPTLGLLFDYGSWYETGRSF